MYKVKSILRGREKDWVSALESQVSIDLAQVLFNVDVPNALEAEKPSKRYVEPIGLFHENNYWYLLGHCHLRQAYRHFRTDKMLGIQRTDRAFQLAHGTLDELRSQKKSQKKTKVRILVDGKIARYIEGSKKHYGFISENRQKIKWK